MSTLLKFVTIDPSLRNFGIGTGTIDLADETLPINMTHIELVSTETDKSSRKVVRRNSEDLERARTLYRGARRLAAGASIMFVEVPVGSQSARSMASYGICIGLIASLSDIPIIEVTPTEVKLSAVGNKTASKREMIAWASELYPDLPWHQGKSGLADKNEHLADAIAAVHAGVLTEEFARLASVFRLRTVAA
ncbi:RuvC family protein [Aeromonas caviae]|uniref:hypothetical protein n=1 Tax=Aeromonas caviae TaxID=648 RepID=UPI0029D6F9B5|nr:hypothetical protein [Aeromonas caviae]MDX7711785.1 hypothetical protein [Aeromonas caviae]